MPQDDIAGLIERLKAPGQYVKPTATLTPKPMGGQSDDYRLLSLFAARHKFTITDANAQKGHNEGSKHYQGKAIDVRVSDKNDDEIRSFMRAATAAGIRVIDERVRPKGQKVWCVAEGQRVLTSLGLKPIEGIETGELVWARSGWVPVVDRLDNGTTQVLRITTARGYSLEVSANHKLMGLDCGEVLAGDLCHGSWISLIPGSATEIPLLSLEPEVVRGIENPVSFPALLDEEFAWWLGNVYGDGHVERGKKIVVALSDDHPEIGARFDSLTRSLFGVSHYVGLSSGCSGYVISSMPVVRFLERNGLLKGKAATISVPDLIWKSRTSVQLAFVAGFFDADGYVGGYKVSATSISSRMIRDLQDLLMAAGVLTSVRKRLPKDRQPAHHLIVLGKSGKSILASSCGIKFKRIGDLRDDRALTPFGRLAFGHSKAVPRKLQNPLDRMTLGSYSTFNVDAAPIVLDQVVSVESIGHRRVFDLSLESEHWFYCEGFYIHNSGSHLHLQLADRPNLTQILFGQSAMDVPEEPKASAYQQPVVDVPELLRQRRDAPTWTQTRQRTPGTLEYAMKQVDKTFGGNINEEKRASIKRYLSAIDDQEGYIPGSQIDLALNIAGQGRYGLLRVLANPQSSVDNLDFMLADYLASRGTEKLVPTVHGGQLTFNTATEQIKKRWGFGDVDMEPKVLTAVAKMLAHPTDHSLQSNETVSEWTKILAAGSSDNALVGLLKAPGYGLSILPQTLQVGTGALLGADPDTILTEEAIKDSVSSRIGSTTWQFAKYFANAPVAIGSDIASIAGRIGEVGIDAIPEFVQGTLESANVFERGIDPVERVARGVNAVLGLWGISHSARAAFEKHKYGPAATELSKRMTAEGREMTVAEAMRVLKTLDKNMAEHLKNPPNLIGETVLKHLDTLYKIDPESAPAVRQSYEILRDGEKQIQEALKKGEITKDEYWYAIDELYNSMDRVERAASKTGRAMAYGRIRDRASVENRLINLGFSEPDALALGGLVDSQAKAWSKTFKKPVSEYYSSRFADLTYRGPGEILDWFERLPINASTDFEASMRMELPPYGDGGVFGPGGRSRPGVNPEGAITEPGASFMPESIGPQHPLTHDTVVLWGDHPVMPYEVQLELPQIDRLGGPSRFMDDIPQTHDMIELHYERTESHPYPYLARVHNPLLESVEGLPDPVNKWLRKWNLDPEKRLANKAIEAADRFAERDDPDWWLRMRENIPEGTEPWMRKPADSIIGRRAVIVFDPDDIRALTREYLEQDWFPLEKHPSRRTLGTTHQLTYVDPALLDRGTFDPGAAFDGRFLVRLSAEAKPETVLHELAHVFMQDIPAADFEPIKKWIVDSISKTGSPSLSKHDLPYERFVDAFMTWATTGKAPSKELKPVFETFQQYAINLATSSKGDIHVPENVRVALDRLVTEGPLSKEPRDKHNMFFGDWDDLVIDLYSTGEIAADQMSAVRDIGKDIAAMGGGGNGLSGIWDEFFGSAPKRPKKGWIESITDVWKASVLFSLHNALQNVKGNAMQSLGLSLSRLPRAGVDKLLSRSTGLRTRIAEFGNPLEGWSNPFKDLPDGVADSIKLDIEAELKAGKKTDADLHLEGRIPVLSKGAELVFKFVDLQDRPWWLKAYNKSLQEQWAIFKQYTNQKPGIVAGFKDGKVFFGDGSSVKLSSDNWQGLLEAKLPEAVKTEIRAAMDSAHIQAVADAEYATLKNRNVLADSVTAAKGNRVESPIAYASNTGLIREHAKRVGQGALRNTIDFLMPFVRIPTNIGLRVAEWSPLGIIKGGIEWYNLRGFVKGNWEIGGKKVPIRRMQGSDPVTAELQRNVADLIGNGLTGTALIALGYAGYQQGWALPFRDKTEWIDEQTAGERPGVLLFGNTWVDTAESHVGRLLTFGATLAKSSEVASSHGEAIKDDLKAFLSQATETPIHGGTELLSKIISGDKPVEAAASELANRLSGFVPGIVSEVRSVTGPTQRVTERAADAFFDSTLGQAQSRLAAVDDETVENYVRNPPRTDNLGRVLKRGFVSKAFGVSKTKTQDPIVQLLREHGISLGKLGTAKRNDDQYGLPDSQGKIGEDVRWDRNNHDYQERVAFVGARLRVALEEFLQSPLYQDWKSKGELKGMLKDEIKALIHEERLAASDELNSMREIEGREAASRAVWRFVLGSSE